MSMTETGLQLAARNYPLQAARNLKAEFLARNDLESAAYFAQREKQLTRKPRANRTGK